jgi:uncharacterized protein YprB with RNaseH-like and TPR domain
MTVFDIETNGLLDVLTKIHVLSYSHDGKEVKHTHDYDEMRKFFTETETLVGHNIIRFDIPAVEKVLGHQGQCTSSRHSGPVLVSEPRPSEAWPRGLWCGLRGA